MAQPQTGSPSLSWSAFPALLVLLLLTSIKEVELKKMLFVVEVEQQLLLSHCCSCRRGQRLLSS